MKRYIQYIIAAAILLPIALSTSPAEAQQEPLMYMRPYDQRGINYFESPKDAMQPYNGFEVYWGAAFTQQFQMIDHETGAPDVELVDLGAGFNLATANLLLGAQLADGIQVNVVTYLSSQHHSEAWVKGGYLQVDQLPMLNSEALDNLFEYVTIRAGHFEINYGDAHFRRTDNAQAIYNPFVGNLIMDSFATEIGGEVYVQKNGLLGMIGITNGEIKGAVVNPDTRAPSIYGKVAFDRQINDDLRARLSGSIYTTSKSASNTLYSGDRAGTRFYDVLVTEAGSNFRNGRINPGFRNKVTAIQINPFVKFQGFELHGLYETATGNAAEDAEEWTYDQMAVDAIYRFLEDESVYIGGRYNVVNGEVLGGEDISVDRIQVAAGWFPTPNILMKVNYVKQNYNDYPETSLFHEAMFDGITIEGVVSF